MNNLKLFKISTGLKDNTISIFYIVAKDIKTAMAKAEKLDTTAPIKEAVLVEDEIYIVAEK